MTEAEFIRATLVERRDTTRDTGVFIFEPERDLEWEAGQYVTIGLTSEAGQLIQRPYSIASASFEKRIELFMELVRREDGGQLTPLLWEMKVGDTCRMRPRIRGKFTFDVESGRRHHFLVGTVTGAAPYISMVRELAHRADERERQGYRLYLLHGASRSKELSYDEELGAIARDAAWFTYVPTISRPWEDPDWTGETGRADDVLRKHLARIDAPVPDITAYLCGHPGMIENAEGMLRRARFEKEQIKTEVYF